MNEQLQLSKVGRGFRVLVSSLSYPMVLVFLIPLEFVEVTVLSASYVF